MNANRVQWQAGPRGVRGAVGPTGPSTSYLPNPRPPPSVVSAPLAAVNPYLSTVSTYRTNGHLAAWAAWGYGGGTQTPNGRRTRSLLGGARGLAGSAFAARWADVDGIHVHLSPLGGVWVTASGVASGRRRLRTRSAGTRPGTSPDRSTSWSLSTAVLRRRAYHPESNTNANRIHAW